MTTFTVETKALRAIAEVAADAKDLRKYLRCVYFERDRMVASNGVTAAVVAIEQHDGPYVLIPAEICKHAAKSKDKTITIDLDQQLIGNVKFIPLDQNYPDWRRVIPESCSGEVAQFDPELIAAAAKFYKTLGAQWHYMTIHHNGAGAAVVSTKRQGACFVMMPLRDNVKSESTVTWARSES